VFFFFPLFDTYKVTMLLRAKSTKRYTKKKKLRYQRANQKSKQHPLEKNN